MSRNVLIFWGAILVLVIGVIGASFFVSAQPGRLDSFAQCLKDKGAVFYGAFWCPHCQATKAMFGRSAKLLPYVECSTPDGKDQLPACKEKEVQNYPTWIFASGERKVGELTLEQLSQETGCALPQ